MGFLDRVTGSLTSYDHRPRDLVSHVAETGEYCGFSYLAGRINTQYGDRAKFRGHDVTYLAGMAGFAISTLADVFGYGNQLTHHAGLASTALLGAHFCAKGAEDGLAAAKKLPEERKKTAALGGATALGAIPPMTQPNKYLDLEKCAAIASMPGAAA